MVLSSKRACSVGRWTQSHRVIDPVRQERPARHRDGNDACQGAKFLEDWDLRLRKINALDARKVGR